MTNIHHTIDYVELTSAACRTRAFYEQAFGWAFNDYGPAYAGIRWPAATARSAASTPPARRSAAARWCCSTPTTSTPRPRRSERAGGEVVEGPYEFPGGRRFHFTDPAGNELGVWATR